MHQLLWAVLWDVPRLSLRCTLHLPACPLLQGQVKDLKRLQEARRSVGFDRSPDGRVFLYTEDGEPFQVKNDMGVPGLLLLR